MKAFVDRHWPKIVRHRGVLFSSYDRDKYFKAYKAKYGDGDRAVREWKKRDNYSDRFANNIKTRRIPEASKLKDEAKRELAAFALATPKTEPVDKVEKVPTKYIPHLGRKVVTKWKGSDVRYCMVHLWDGKDPGQPRAWNLDPMNLDDVIRVRSYHPEYTILVYVRKNGAETIVAEYRPIFGGDGNRLRVDFITDRAKLKQWNE